MVPWAGPSRFTCQLERARPSSTGVAMTTALSTARAVLRVSASAFSSRRLPITRIRPANCLKSAMVITSFRFFLQLLALELKVSGVEVLDVVEQVFSLLPLNFIPVSILGYHKPADRSFCPVPLPTAGRQVHESCVVQLKAQIELGCIGNPFRQGHPLPDALLNDKLLCRALLQGIQKDLC